jgi:HAMP domain-containing protein/HPt (histidine-containing phosphotransfer) domain-containing protein/two-component sensor histidine kinase
MSIFSGISSKLLVVCVSFSLPIAVMSYQMTKAKQKEIDFGTWELYGDKYQRPLENLLEQISLHRWNVLRTASGQPDGNSSDLLKIQSALDAKIADLVNVDNELGTALQFTAEGLGKRQRPEFTVANLRSRWEELKQKVNAGDLAESDEAHKTIINHIKTMITHAGDTSNLILDPDLDSYYLMDVTLLALPQMQDRLQQVGAFVEKIYGKGEFSNEDHLQARLYAGFLKEADLDRIAASTQTALNEDANFYGKSPTLQANLTLGLATLSPKITAVVTLLNEIEAGTNHKATLSEFRAALDQALQAAFAFHSVAFDEEDQLLSNRVSIFKSGVYDALIIGAFSALISALLAFFVSRNLVRRVKHVSATTKSVAAGNMKSRVKMSGKDEIAELGSSFDSMTDKIESLAAEISERNRELKTINSSLEDIVTARTAQITTILNNVRAGFLLVGRDLKIEEGFSHACVDLFGDDFKAGTHFLNGIGLQSDRNSEMWTAFLEQTFDDNLPEEMTLQQLPQRFTYGDKIIALDSRAVRNTKNEVICILFTFHDATTLDRAEEEGRHQHLLVRILREVDFFRDFIEEFKTRVSLCKRFLRGGEHGKARAELHTLKGNSSAYDLTRIAKCIHEIEDQSQISANDIEAIELEMRLFLTTNYEVLQLTYDSTFEDSFVVTKSDISMFTEKLRSAAHDGSALDHLKEWIDSMQYRPAKTLVGPMAEYGKRLGERLMKTVEVQIKGGDTKMNPEIMKPVLQSLVHLVRNAIDHGIEEAGARGIKSELSVVDICFFDRPDIWIVEVTDDGRGIDADELVKKAIKDGALRPEQALKMTRAEKEKLIFLSGLSTSDHVSDISGRGVGMNAVSSAVLEAGGELEVFSEVGKGTTFRLSIPKRFVATVPRLAAVNG